MKKILSFVLLAVLSFVFVGCQTTELTTEGTTTTTVPVVYTITLTGQQTVQVDHTITLTATSNKTGAAFTWISDAPAIATVSAAGLVTGVSSGTANITVSATGMDPKSIAVTVTPYAFTLSGMAGIKLGAGTIQLAYTTDKENPTVTWSTSNAAIATVNTTGLVTPVAIGKVTITCALAGVGSLTKYIFIRDAKALSIGSTTEAGVNMFSTFWGNNATNADIRSLCFGYGTVALQMVDDINYDPTQGAKYEIDPSVVKEFETTPNVDGSKTYTITLQEDLLWSDEHPIDAKDFVFPMLLGINPVFATAIGKSLTTTGDILGSKAYANADVNDDGKYEFSGVDFISQYKFSITINADRFPYYYEYLYYSVNPWPLHVIVPDGDIVQGYEGAKFTGEFTADSLQATVDQDGEGYRYDISVTCGPYKLYDFDQASSTATLVINDFFKGDVNGVKPTIEPVMFKYVTTATQMTALVNGEIDLIESVSGGAAIEAGLDEVEAGHIEFSTFYRNGYGLIGFHCDPASGPTSSTSVRQAIAYVINRELFLDTYTLGYGILPNGQYGMAQWMVAAATNDEGNVEGIDENGDFVELNDYAYNTTTATALLVADGWVYNSTGGAFAYNTAGAGGLNNAVRYKRVGTSPNYTYEPLTIAWGNSSNNPVSDLLRAQLVPNAMTIGMQVTDNTMDFNTLLYTHYYGAYGDGYLMPEDNGDGVWNEEDIPGYEVVDADNVIIEEDLREYHMVNLGTGFTTGIFEPYYDVSIEYWGWDGGANISYLYDQAMLDAAFEMMRAGGATQAEADAAYLEAWQKFQYRYNILLPNLPLYSDNYHAFYSLDLQDYNVTAEWTMTEALIYASMAE